MEGVEVVDGLCSNSTIQALIKQTCMNEIFSLPSHLRNTILFLIRSLCRHEVYDYFLPRPLLTGCSSDCSNYMTNSGVVLYQNFNCLTDCTESNCLSLLFTDFYNAGGVCNGSSADVQLNWPVSSQPCQMSGTNVMEGLCRAGTLAGLLQPTCRNIVLSLSAEQWNVIRNMIRSLCQQDLDNYFNPRPIFALLILLILIIIKTFKLTHIILVS